jgi:Undecaprenyl-phosphate glucose phosphotransferase
MSIGSEIPNRTRELDRAPATRPARLSSNAVPYLLSTADAFVIVVSSILSGIGYQLAIGNAVPSILPHCAVGLLASFIHILRMSGAGYYDFPDSAKPRVEITEILLCWFTTGLLLAFFAFLLKIGVAYSRGAFVIFYFVAPAGLLAVRRTTKSLLASAVSRGTIGRRDIVVIGDFHELAAIETKDTLAFFGSAEVTRFNLSMDSDAQARNEADTKVIGLAADFVRRNDCKEVILAMPWADAERMEFVRDAVKTLPVAVRLLPDTRVRSLTNYASSARQRVLAIEIQRAPLSTAERAVKRTMDVVIATLALIFFLPVMALTAIAIKLDSPGPVIFRQFRKGFNGRLFMMFKFRTMNVLENGATVTQASRDDPRITPIGALLRSASIDELPQLINVLRGEMSLIGPRPHALAHDNYFEEVLSDYAYRHHVKPGMTGWAQCNGARGATPTIQHISERVRLDLWYINNWSLWLDVQIMIKTFFEVLRKRNAY